MGLFDFFLKKKPVPQKQTSSNNTVLKEVEQTDDPKTSVDFNPLNIDSVIGYIKTQRPDATEEDVANIITKLAEPEEDQDHLTPEGELPWGWVHYYQQFTGQQEKKIDTKWKSVYSASTTREKLEAYEKYFGTVARVGAVCKKTGECHYKWFCEYILDSDWYKSQVVEYEKYKIAAPDLIKRDTLLETLEHDVMSELQECGGMLQSDFVKLFDPLIKTDVSAFLYNAEKYGRIKRTKSGRSYILEIKK